MKSLGEIVACPKLSCRHSLAEAIAKYSRKLSRKQASQSKDVAGLVVVAWVWRRPATLAMRASVLVIAVPLATPYVQFYDLAILSLPIAWLVWEARARIWLGGEQLALAGLWIAPVAVWILAERTGFLIWPLIFAGMLALLVRRIRRNSSRVVGARVDRPVDRWTS